MECDFLYRMKVETCEFKGKIYFFSKPVGLKIYKIISVGTAEI